MRRTVTEVLQRGYAATVANWQLIAIRFAEAIVMIGMLLWAVLAMIIPFAISAGMGRFENLGDAPSAAAAIATAIIEHWIVIVYALVIFMVVLFLAVMLHSFVDAGCTQILVDSERQEVRPSFDMRRWLQGGRKSWWAVFWIYNLIWSIAGLVLLVPLTITLAGTIIVDENMPRIAIACGGIALTILIFVPIAVISTLWTQKSIAVCVARGVKAAEAMRAARREGTADFGRHFAVAIIVMVVSLGGAGVLSMFSFPASMMRAGSVSLGIIAPIQIIVSVAQSIFSAAVGTWFLASFVALTENR